MSSTTRNQLQQFYQGQFTAAIGAFPANYPDDVPTWGDGRNVADSVNSNTHGILLPERYCNEDIVIDVACTGDDGQPSAGVAVYGCVRRYMAANLASQVDLDSSTALLEPWHHLHNLNNGTAISVSTNACASVNVIQTGTNSWHYTEAMLVGAMYRRILVVPVSLSGATTLTLNAWVSYAGGMK